MSRGGGGHQVIVTAIRENKRREHEQKEGKGAIDSEWGELTRREGEDACPTLGITVIERSDVLWWWK